MITCHLQFSIDLAYQSKRLNAVQMIEQSITENPLQNPHFPVRHL